jgi:phosphoribosylanthranilate isomerase
MKVKICGIRSYEAARAALDAGAWAIGFVFHAPSRRFIAPADAAEIIRRLPAGALTVGVFVDEPLEVVNQTVAAAGLRGAQLHGREDAAYVRGVGADLVIKALRVGAGFDPRSVLGFPGARILLDTHWEGAPGGTGRTFDWSLARQAGELAPVIIAGGLDPENVEEAIRSARPDGLDVSSGVESEPGVKDHGKIARLFAEVERTERTRLRDSPTKEPPW